MKAKFLLIALFVIQFIFVASILANHRGYQDSWILEDIFVPTVLYVIGIIVLVSLTDDIRLLVLFSSIFAITLNAIPNLKYDLFYGNFDSAAHFGNARELIQSGLIPQTGYYGSTYYDFPGLHLYLSYFSMILGIDLNTTTKIVSSFIFGIIPLMTYLATKNIFEKDLQKFIIVASVLPTVASYALVGTAFALPLFFAFMCLLLKSHLAENHKREFAVLSIFFVFSLLFSHMVSILSLAVFLAIMICLLKLIRLVRSHFVFSTTYAYGGVFLIIFISLIAWLSLKADYMFKLLVNQLILPLRGQPNAIPIPSRFYQVPLLDEINVLLVFYLGDVLILILSAFGLYVLYRLVKRKEAIINRAFYLPIICFVCGIFLVIIVQLTTNIGGVEYRRFMGYGELFAPFFIGVLLWKGSKYFKKTLKLRYVSTVLIGLILFATIFFSLFEVFPYQPLEPTANVLSPNLPSNSYILDLRNVNTVYQQSMIVFAERFSPPGVPIAADVVTRWQGFAFSNDTFNQLIQYGSPLVPATDYTVVNQSILLHYSDKAASFNEQVEYRTNGAIDNLRLTNRVIYDNGGSCIIQRTSPQTP